MRPTPATWSCCTCSRLRAARALVESLLEGEIRSCFAMTEPDSSSSDAPTFRPASNCKATNGDQRPQVVHHRAMRSRCRIAIVMGITNPNGERHRQQSMVLVPLDTPGVTLVRNISVMNHLSDETHCEVLFRNVRVPRANLLGDEGSGFALAQARLGPGASTIACAVSVRRS